MSDSKVFMFPDSPCQATNGTDPATLMAMMDLYLIVGMLICADKVFL